MKIGLLQNYQYSLNECPTLPCKMTCSPYCSITIAYQNRPNVGKQIDPLTSDRLCSTANVNIEVAISIMLEAKTVFRMSSAGLNKVNDVWLPQWTAASYSADFHSKMVEITSGEKLLIGRRPVKNWSGPNCIFSLFQCELRVIIDVTDVMICSLQSVSLFLCRKLH